MMLRFVHWLVKNLSTLLLALILALIVWVSAVVTADPNEQNTFGPVLIEQVGKEANLIMVGEVPDQAQLTLVAPKSIWERLLKEPALVHAWVDLSGLDAGEYTLPVKTRLDISPVRLLQIEPSELQVRLEPLVQAEFPILLTVNGELPVGYKLGEPILEPLKVNVSGPAPEMAKVSQVRAPLDVSGAIETIEKTINLVAVDENGIPITNVTISPKSVAVKQPISLLGGFKNVVVRVVTKGQVANGYRLTNISVSPPTVTLFADDPKVIDEIPGFVDTVPIDLTNLSDDLEIRVGLNLAEGITLVREPSVLVQVSVAAIEGSLTLSLPVEVIGLMPELEAVISPATIDVIVAGPLHILEELTTSSFRVVLDLTGLPPGVYQRSPLVDMLPDEVRVQTTLPETVEVTIVLVATPTPNLTPSSIQASPTPTPKP